MFYFWCFLHAYFNSVFPGVDPNVNYPTLYRYFVEVWIYLGLAWLSLFFNWKVRMVIEAHKALKKRRKRRKLSLDEFQHYKETNKALRLPSAGNDVNIFSFLSKKKEGYNDLIKQIGTKNGEDQGGSSISSKRQSEFIRSKSCNDAISINGNTILNLDQSPRQKRRYSFSDRVTVVFSKSKNYLLGTEEGPLLNEMQGEGELDIEMERMYENQLDKEAGEEHRNIGAGGCGLGRHLWDSNEYQPVIFQNANITFIDEENLLNNSLVDEDEDEDIKVKLSTSDENGESETDSKDEQCSESEGSVFTNRSDHCHSYEQLVEEYSKENNTDNWSLEPSVFFFFLFFFKL